MLDMSLLEQLCPGDAPQWLVSLELFKLDLLFGQAVSIVRILCLSMLLARLLARSDEIGSLS